MVYFVYRKERIMDFIRFAKNITSKRRDWIFAKTMPENPHWYTLLKDWGNPDAFYNAVEYIREHGYQEKFGWRYYTYFDLNEYKYWTMGAPVEDTILINKARNGHHKSDYDKIAKIYDSIHQNKECIEENKRLMDIIDYNGGSVLDIGCGTGLFLEYANPDGYYMGVDPSINMLQVFRDKHEWLSHNVVHSRFENFYTSVKFDLIVCLFGSANYIEEEALKRIPYFLNDEGGFFVMLYKDDYFPKTYIESGIEVDRNFHSPDILEGECIDFNNFWIVKGGRQG